MRTNWLVCQMLVGSRPLIKNRSCQKLNCWTHTCWIHPLKSQLSAYMCRRLQVFSSLLCKLNTGPRRASILVVMPRNHLERTHLTLRFRASTDKPSPFSGLGEIVRESGDGPVARREVKSLCINMQSLDPVGTSFPHPAPAFYTCGISFQNNSILFT